MPCPSRAQNIRRVAADQGENLPDRNGRMEKNLDLVTSQLYHPSCDFANPFLHLVQQHLISAWGRRSITRTVDGQI
jgi:hypothetical protein